MSSRQAEQLQVEVNYYRDRVALLRAKLYRWGVGSNARLQQLERAEQRLRDARLHSEP